MYSKHSLSSWQCRVIVWLVMVRRTEAVQTKRMQLVCSSSNSKMSVGDDATPSSSDAASLRCDGSESANPPILQSPDPLSSAD